MISASGCSNLSYDMANGEERRVFSIHISGDLSAERFHLPLHRLSLCECSAGCLRHKGCIQIALQLIAREVVYAFDTWANVDVAAYTELFFGLCEHGWRPEVWHNETAWVAYRNYKRARSSAIAVASLDGRIFGGPAVTQLIARWAWADRTKLTMDNAVRKQSKRLK